MKIYLMRHGHAIDGAPFTADEHRFLSEFGRNTVRKIGTQLGAEGVVFDAVVTSPLVRAVQTAELVVASIGFAEKVEAIAELTPAVPPTLAAPVIASRGRAVLVVGHEPNLSALGALLVGRPAFPGFRPGQVALIESGAPRWTISSADFECKPLLVA